MARLIFFGTPEFAVPSLLALDTFCKQNHHTIAAVVTQPDQPQKRHQKLQACPVKNIALSLNIPVLQPHTLKKNTLDGDTFFKNFVDLQIDLAIVVAYGQIITQRLLSSSRLGFINIHASMLPHLRGASPIQYALKEGLKETAVCLMDMQIKLDEGDVFVNKPCFIMPNDTYETLSQRLSIIGAYLLKDNLDNLLNQKLKKHPQDHSISTYAGMIKKEEGLLNFNLSGQVLQNNIRAYEPWPGSFAFINTKRVKFFESFFIKGLAKEITKNGTIISINPYLAIKVNDGVLFFKKIQLEGKKVLPIKEALLGFNIKPGMIID